MLLYAAYGGVFMFLELQNKDGNYRKRYFDMLKYRLAYGSLELEGIEGDLADEIQSLKISNQLDAIDYIFEYNIDANISPMEYLNLLCEIADRTTGGEVSYFRKTKACVIGSNVERSNPAMIRNDLYYLVDDYKYWISNCKSVDELYEIEARFHIRLLHIHPFEDGNGRTARTILVYNLCNHNIAPCIITKEVKKEYCDYIENGDEKKLADLIKRLSHKEFKNMLSLYKELDRKGLIEDNIMSPELEEKYSDAVKALKKRV